MIYARILEPRSKRSSYKAASEFLEKPSYKLHDVYRALDVLGAECDLIQAELYKNSHFLGARNDKVLYYDCSNYYFEIEQEDGNKKYGKAKNTDQIRSFKWVCLWMATASPLLFLPLQEMQTNRHPSNHWKKRYLESLDARNSFTAVMQAWDPNLSVNTTIWGNVLIS